MADKQKQTKDSKPKASEQEMQEWLDAVHFGSCCSDPLESGDDKKIDKVCEIKKSN